MNIGQAIIEALESLTGNKLRAGLTILGIVIGVAAVVAMMSIGTGAQNSISSTINSIGTNLLIITSGKFERGASNTVQRIEPLTLADAEALADQTQAPDIAAVAPIIQSDLTASYNGESESVGVSGVTSEYATVRNVKIAEGEFITAEDENSKLSVAVIGSTTADNLFGTHTGVIGNTIRISGQPFQVIGVLEASGSSITGSSTDDVVYVPLSTARVRLIFLSNNRVSMIYLSAASSDQVTAASDEATAILEQRHSIKNSNDDFTITNQAELLSTSSSIISTLTYFLGGIAGISLLVGGIGIMNIMLVSVTERTREIGLRKAIGARKKDILIQFLTESALLSMLGGILGIILGWLIGLIVAKIAASSSVSLTPVMSIQAVLLATMFSTAVGLFFGIYPANRAASLQPVDALRYE
jgi:putative ABC transport system permease protein